MHDAPVLRKGASLCQHAAISFLPLCLQAQHCELGFGPNGRKSAACPDKCLALEGFTNHMVAVGVGHMLHLVTAASDKELDKLPVWENARVEDPRESAGKGGKGAKAGTKRKAEPAAAKGGRGKGGKGRK